MSQSEFFKPRFKSYSPEDVKRIMQTLGETPVIFAERFFVSEAAVKAWISPVGSSKHREVLGAAARCMYWAEVEISQRGSSQNNLIRLGMKK